MSEENQTRVMIIAFASICLSIYMAWSDSIAFNILKDADLAEELGFFSKLIGAIVGTLLGTLCGFIGLFVGDIFSIFGNGSRTGFRFFCSIIGIVVGIMIALKFVFEVVS